MLLEFSVTNFRSIKEKQTLSLLKTKKNELEGNWTTITLSTGKTLDVLNSAVIYGANASGKSNILLALQVMQDIIQDSAGYLQNQSIQNIQRFLLSKGTHNQPTEFELDFIDNDVRFVYGFSATREKILDEWLHQYPKGRPQTLIERENTHTWGAMSALKGNKKLWQESTKDNSLFLSTALQLNCQQLFEVVVAINDIACLSSDFNQQTIVAIISNAAQAIKIKKQVVLDFFQKADIGIDDFLFIEDKQNNTHAIKLKHKTSDNDVVLFDLEKESNGTQKVIALAMFWIGALDKGSCVILDELQNSLHPKLVEYLVQMFHDPEINKNGAQLIFVTHETSLLDQEIFRRDQVWFCEKENNATELFSLADFSVRKGTENVEKFYLSGRYGAVPYLR